jgi:RNA polymerase sigma-70 factor (ECF subfamily)
MDKRLVRARAKIRDARITFELPGATQFPARLADVLAVLYLIFSEGYASSGDGPRLRTDLCDEAIWLARQVRTMRPADGECTGLLALMLLQRARAAARQDDAGHLVAYDEQDRSLWNTALIQEARALLATTGQDALGPYQVEAAIALMHATASNSASVPWIRIAELYTVLQRMTPTPVIALNRAYAIGRAHDARTGLQILTPLLREQTLARYAPLHLVHADLLQRDGQVDLAVNAWQVAIALSADAGQRAELRRRAARLGLTLPATAAE